MSAPTGIAVSHELSSAFSDAIESKNIRFLKISIRNVNSSSGTINEDMDRIGSILEDDVPAYVLVRLDDPPAEWLAIYYVPESAKVRDKMLYAATRTTLTKSLGSAHFTDSIFATSKDDLSAEAYVKHKQHLAAPQPMSEREKEMAVVKAAEREAGGAGYEEARARQTHVGKVGLKWSDEVENALRELASSDEAALMLITIDPASETVLLSSKSECSIDRLGSAIPASEPSYAFFAWPQSITSPPRREIIFIYSCPSSAPIKHRMLYSSGVAAFYDEAKGIISSLDTASRLAARRIETSDPTELADAYLVSELGLASALTAGSSAVPVLDADKKPFARPKGPGRKR